MLAQALRAMPQCYCWGLVELMLREYTSRGNVFIVAAQLKYRQDLIKTTAFLLVLHALTFLIALRYTRFHEH